MKGIKSFISFLFFICIANAVHASPSNTNGRYPLCNPNKTVVSCNIDTSVAMHGVCPDGEYFAKVYLFRKSSVCNIALYTSDFETDYGLHYVGDTDSDELCEKLDIFTYWYHTNQYMAPLIITIKDSHIVEIRSDDTEWDKFDRWIGKTFYGIDGYVLLN